MNMTIKTKEVKKCSCTYLVKLVGCLFDNPPTKFSIVQLLDLFHNVFTHFDLLKFVVILPNR